MRRRVLFWLEAPLWAFPKLEMRVRFPSGAYQSFPSINTNQTLASYARATIFELGSFSSRFRSDLRRWQPVGNESNFYLFETGYPLSFMPNVSEVSPLALPALYLPEHGVVYDIPVSDKEDVHHPPSPVCCPLVVKFHVFVVQTRPAHCPSSSPFL